MKVFIIGGTGLISTAINEQLVARGDEVVLFNRGKSKLRGPKPAKIILGDRNDEAALTAAIRAEKPDALIDMMAFAPEQAQALLRACEGQTPQIVMCSTVCVYGGPLTKLPADDNEPHRPVGNYGKNKSEIERITLSREGKSGQHATVIRPSHSTGGSSDRLMGNWPAGGGLCGLEMGDADREGVGRVGLWRLGEPQRGADHEGDLALLRGAVAHDGLFDAGWGIFVDRQAALGGRENG